MRAARRLPLLLAAAVAAAATVAVVLSDRGLDDEAAIDAHGASYALDAADTTSLAGTRSAATPLAQGGVFDGITDVDVLLAALAGFPDVAAAARDRLAALAREDPTVIARLIQWLRPENDDGHAGPDLPFRTRELRIAHLQRALAAMGEPAVAPLIAALSDADAVFRVRAIGALALLGPTAAPAVPALAPLVAGAYDEQVAAIYALAGIGAAAGPHCRRSTRSCARATSTRPWSRQRSPPCSRSAA
jgi:hypothetical protein